MKRERQCFSLGGLLSSGYTVGVVIAKERMREKTFVSAKRSFPCFLLGSTVHACWELLNLEQLQLHGSMHEAADVADQSGEPN